MAVQFIDLKAQYNLISDDVAKAVQSVFEHGQYILGKELKELEEELAEFVNTSHVLGVSSGTDALVIPLMALGIGPGDAVFVPSFTYTATAEAIVICGASPVFVEVDENTFNIDVEHLKESVEKVRSEGKLVPKVVLAVDLFGQPARYDLLMPYCEQNELIVLGDAAQGFGGQLGNKQIGSLAHVTGTSFYPSKPLACYGDGGAVFTNDGELADIMCSIRGHGQGAHKYDVVRIGMNGRLDTLQAAILLQKMKLFPDELEARERIAQTYDAELKSIVQVPERIPNSRSAWAQYTIKTNRRKHLMDGLKDLGVPTMVFYPKPMHLQEAYKKYGHGEGSLPVCEKICEEVISLPMHPYLSETDQSYIIGSIKKVMSGN